MKLILVALAFVVGVHASVERLDLAADAEWLSKYWDEYLSAREPWLPPVSMEPTNSECAGHHPGNQMMSEDAFETYAKEWLERNVRKSCDVPKDQNREWCVYDP